MTMNLPNFKYHPDPIKTDSIKVSDVSCECCKRQMGYVYSGSLYSASDVSDVCPWCIANGEAHQMFDIQFTTLEPAIFDPENPPEQECSDAACEELLHRTPGFSSFQEQSWLSHCGDFCAFHGLATVGDFKRISDQEKARFADVEYLTDAHIATLQEGADDTEHHYYFKFVCLNCSEVMFQSDPD